MYSISYEISQRPNHYKNQTGYRQSGVESGYKRKSMIDVAPARNKKNNTGMKRIQSVALDSDRLFVQLQLEMRKPRITLFLNGKYLSWRDST